MDLLWRLTTHPVTLIGVGGAVGSVLRYYASVWIREQLQCRVIWGTFAVNVSGCFLVALFALLFLQRLPHSYRAWYLLLGTGFCGGFTTFSTFELETFELIRDEEYRLALFYVAGSFVCGFLGVLLAVALVHGLLGRPTTP